MNNVGIVVENLDNAITFFNGHKHAEQKKQH